MFLGGDDEILNSPDHIFQVKLQNFEKFKKMKLNKNVSSDRSKSRKRHFGAPSHVRWVLLEVLLGLSAGTAQNIIWGLTVEK